MARKPKKNENWVKWPKFHSIADEYGDVAPWGPGVPETPTVKGYFHAYGINGLEGVLHEPEHETPIVSPKTKRMYTATVQAEQPRDRSVWPRKTTYTLKHIQEHTGMDEVANQISGAMDFMDVTGSDSVDFSNDVAQPAIDSHDLVKNLYEKRPNFPKSFNSLNRAQFVSELLIKRRDAGIPLTPRPRRGN
jgi:hypothetical protein